MVYKRRRLLFIFLLAIIFIAIFITNRLRLKTIEIEQTTLDYGMNANALIIQKEDLVYFNGKNNIEMQIQEGMKASLENVIASTKGVVFNNKDSLNLEIINWKLENEMHQENLMFKQDLDKIYHEIKKMEARIEREKKLKKHEKVERLEKKKEQLIHKKQVIEGSFRFAFLNQERLKDIKNQLLDDEKNNNIIKGQISAKDIGINYSAYVYFQKDGLENLLHRDLLGSIDVDYYDGIENMISNGTQSNYFENQQTLKFVDDTNLFMIIKVPKKFLKEEEENLLKSIDAINAQWKESGQSNIYDFIEKRRDILKLLPEVRLRWKDKIIKGTLIDSNLEGTEHQKIITLKINTQNHKLVGKRQIEIYVYDKLYEGFVLPNKSIIKRNEKDGVVLLGKANDKIFTEIFIQNKTDEFVILDPEENTALKPGNKILASPKQGRMNKFESEKNR